MATLTIRKLDDRLMVRLRVRAAHNGRSMEEEAREILKSALEVEEPSLGEISRSSSTRKRPLTNMN
jgi:antitoxin FitA